jgi:pimeloyl-ACP methyl ester carboxylesterase
MLRHTVLFVVVTAFVAAGCRDQGSLPSDATHLAPQVAKSTLIGGGVQVVDGQTGPGSLYRLYMPATWNGKLVVYAHGSVAPFAPVGIPSEADAVASVFVAQGFAVALSSYSQTGSDIKDGATRTHQLRGLFASQFGQPSRTYLVGSSMGGFIVASLAERFPNQYDGVMPFCGVVGGFTAEFTYLLNVRALFDLLYPNALPGTAADFQLPSDPSAAAAALQDVQAKAQAAIVTDARPLPGSVQIAMIDQTAMPLPSPLGPLTAAQFATFVITPLVAHAEYLNDAVDFTHGHFPFTNVGTTYTSNSPFMGPLLPAINAGVERVAADRSAQNLLQQNGETSGRIGIPMLTLHTRYDPQVPIITESIYAQRVLAAGRADLLVQRTTAGFGHCNFTTQELGTGFVDLVKWVEHGVKPAP